jgi:hypothetical protein
MVYAEKQCIPVEQELRLMSKNNASADKKEGLLPDIEHEPVKERTEGKIAHNVQRFKTDLLKMGSDLIHQKETLPFKNPSISRILS